MSIEQVKRVLRSRGIKGAAKSVLIIMAWYADKEGEKVYPSVKRIADESGFSDRTVQLSIAQLVKAGWVELVSDPKDGVSSKVYRLTVPVNSLHQCNSDTGEATTPVIISTRVKLLRLTGEMDDTSPVKPLHPIRYPEDPSVKLNPDPDARASSPNGLAAHGNGATPDRGADVAAIKANLRRQLGLPAIRPNGPEPADRSAINAALSEIARRKPNGGGG